MSDNPAYFTQIQRICLTQVQRDLLRVLVHKRITSLSALLEPVSVPTDPQERQLYDELWRELDQLKRITL